MPSPLLKSSFSFQLRRRIPHSSGSYSVSRASSARSSRATDLDTVGTSSGSGGSSASSSLSATDLLPRESGK